MCFANLVVVRKGGKGRMEKLAVGGQLANLTFHSLASAFVFRSYLSWSVLKSIRRGRGLPPAQPEREKKTCDLFQAVLEGERKTTSRWETILDALSLGSLGL